MKIKKITFVLFLSILPGILLTQNFVPVWNSPYNPMTIYVLGAELGGANLQTGDEIGVFDYDPNSMQQICVGFGVLTQPLTGGAYLEMIASMNDGSIPGIANGFTPGHAMIFKFFSQVNGLIQNVDVSFPYPGYDQVFASQGSAFVVLSAILPGQLIVTTNANPTNGGITTGDGSYPEGANVTVTATPNDCWDFINWTDNGTVVSVNQIYSFVIENDRNLTANFEQLNFDVIIAANPSGGGIVVGAGTFPCGSEVEVEAIPSDGYSFINWTENGTEVSNTNSYSFILEEDRNLVANFQIELNYFEPVWTSPYNPMTIYITLATLDQLNLQPGSQIGLFDIDPNNGSEICVGAATLNQVITPASYLEFIASMNDGSVAGQANGFTPGNIFRFKYLTNQNVLIEPVNYIFPYPGYNQIFASQGAAIVELSGVSPVSMVHQMDLNQGWTGISSYLIPSNTDLQYIMNQVDNFVIIENLGGFYMPNNPGNTLSDWDYSSGYFVKTTGASILELQGNVPVNKSLNLNVGWNLIPVLSDEQVSIISLFSGQTGKVDIIKDAIGLSVYWPAYSIATLQHLLPGKAYLVKLNQAATITFD